ncbi:MAG: matrixin family metalloprotease [bacterium]|jgi:hypothetical protein
MTPAATLAQLLYSQDPFDQIVRGVTLRGLAQQAARTGSIDIGPVDVCLHPDTSPEDAERILRELPTYIPLLENGMLGYNRSNRWSYTCMDGATGSIGDPITITWGIVPDGTWADGGSSNLFAVFDAQFGGSLWMNKVRNAFDRWEAVIGITYIEVSDDGASMPGSSGSVGVRGDVRIGGRSIDGSGNVLAYNYYPNCGDMVLDTDDASFYSIPIGNYGNLKNVVCHEHGHGMGLGHVIPENCTKLMEAYQCGGGTFVGPQDDDIRGGMRNYGDRYENNDTNAEPTDLGTIVDTLRVETVSIDNGVSDVDWYLINCTSLDLTIEVDPIGSGYMCGPEGGTASWVRTDSISDPDIELYDATGTTLLESATSCTMCETEVLSCTLPSTGSYQVRVFRKTGTGNNVQCYNMTIYYDEGSGIEVASGDDGLATSVYPSPFAGQTTVRFMAPAEGAYAVDVYDVGGRRSRSMEGYASGPGWVESVWDGRDQDGREVASGIYFIRVRLAGFVETDRVLVVR